jgi:hypothetical protein
VPGMHGVGIFRSLGPQFDDRHQASFRVIEDMAVEHPCSWSLVVSHDEVQSLIKRDVDRILPGKGAHWIATVVEHLKEEAMQMDRMRPFRLIRDGPDLGFTNGCPERLKV